MLKGKAQRLGMMKKVLATRKTKPVEMKKEMKEEKKPKMSLGFGPKDRKAAVKKATMEMKKKKMRRM